MSDSYVGEIRMFAGNYAPVKWYKCDGALLVVTENAQLFSLIGNTYGGNGTTNFGLPDLRGRIPVGYGNGAGLTPRTLGQQFGTETVTLTTEQMPSHNHPLRAETTEATDSTPSSGLVLASGASSGTETVNIYGTTANSEKITTFSGSAVNSTGGSQDHFNMMPSLCINFIICHQGVYPQRS